ncbi:MAG: ribonuclease T2 [Pseudomonadota bacterium]
MPTIPNKTVRGAKPLSATYLSMLTLLALLAPLLLPSSSAEAQRAPYRDDNNRGSRHIAGEFDYYALVLSWSPTYCASRKTNRYEPQCHAKRARPYAFVLHGLWPQYTRGYPERCWTRDRPFVPRRIINDMLDIMPSPKLVIHEYKKHGTCTGLTPAGYYDLSRRMFESIKIPGPFTQPVKAQMISPEALSDAFVAANPKLRSDMIAISCGGAGNRLREIRICFSKSGKPTPCGRNENQRRMCSAKRMFIPPVRVPR